MKSLSSLLPCKFPDLGISQLVKFMTTLQWLLLKQNSILATTLLNIKAFRFLGKTFVELAFLTLCDQALNPPFLGGKMVELGKFCFIKTKFEPNLSCFSK